MKVHLYQLSEESPPPFDNTKLLRYNRWAEGRLFLDKEEYIDNTVVDLNHVIGHDQGYGEMTWGELLRASKRSGERLDDLKNNPTYYLSDAEKYDWKFIEVDGKYFISSGKHRTGILLYLAHYNPSQFPNGPLAQGVHVTKKFIDYGTITSIAGIQKELKKPEFCHLELRAVNHPFNNEQEWVLANRHQSARFFTKQSNLNTLLNLLKESTPAKRFFGINNNGYLRKSFLKGFGGGADHIHLDDDLKY